MAARTNHTDYFGDDDDDSIKKASSISAEEIYFTNDGPTDRSPLLSNSPPRKGSYIDIPTPRKGWPYSHRALLLFLTGMVILCNSGDQIMESAQMRIFESIICYRYYEVADPKRILLGREVVGPGAIGGVAEQFCKVDAVQEQLAMLRGYQQLFEGLPALLLAVPFGWAADRYGRKPFLMIGLFSFVLKFGWIQLVTWFWQAFDIRMIWLEALHALLSGGNPVVSGLFFVVLSDICSEGERAAVFLRVGAASLISNLVMPPIGAWLMEINPWIPSLMGTVLTMMPLFAYPIVPETLGYRHGLTPPASHPPTPSVESLPAPPDLSGVREPISADFAGFAAHWLNKGKDAMAFLTRDWRVPALIVPFIAHQLLASATQLLLQYMSKRYDITFSKATLLMSIFNGVKILLLFVILPYISTLMTSYSRMSGQRKDLYLARISMLLMLVGYLLVGFSPNLPSVILSMALASLGQGCYLLVRSFLTSLVPAHHIARVYSIISITDTLGAMFGGALLAGLFKRGMKLGGGWIGLPFYFVALISVVFAGLLFVVGLRPGEGEVKDEDEDEEEL